ncbi:hypothetical protein A2631_03015 [Candidatus Daviesbacteria bacterium RIFCSPHIGHO2_01_FULL_44_29]|uniref:Glycosyltransferase 2-like domain-containing protein n=1 Tax=Candidatus Daviesbacteria bacterium RIFCSPHIGHO2_02_FULL_43_12 TaxID=1797776 RepID=A0A1F5KKN6_9BACT|nr:MAG: hypothetical protein A2631_03015 [Candidatus Daviesbacteria bacterium RIFCSPHIGHO2_01_FULL_44_29]OGE40792.1 MAG: hypothetical protein A3E86_02330 [Candidatus Daviesbacteria bacterium RIFCSPHIGHO2_12_FULL_47_45]OGE41355.1 MAG: hypothetical protein A3D25_02410 [Candidatus Daviesbacteria bacterium RIFCSPHIGHO2_02_FULL_43_12]OGE69556.1 MAG: hypothetical protein A3B55_04155 [Candidatus Daviesbacteria bacterium RIFCSPLOWO2_01_FULL_43_15]
MSNLKLSVIIPGYNEERSLSKGVLAEVDAYLHQVDYKYEVLVVDDGSTDRSVAIIKEQIKKRENFRLIENPHAGKAVTVMTGLLAAKGEIALFTDMDQATPITEVEKLLPQFSEGFDIVIGSRDGRTGSPFIRQLASVVFAILRNIILGLPFSDTQCGFKAFNQKSRQSIFPKLLEQYKKSAQGGYIVNAGFDSEFLFLAKKAGLKIIDVPVEWHHVESKSYQLWKNAIDAVLDMLRIRLRDLTGFYR